jgi:predicted metal-dependent phosphoesterase TrpH
VKLKIDFHVHTNASKDGVSSIKEIVAVAKRRGLDGFAITDHDVVFSTEKAEEISKESGMVVLPGVEVSTKAGHLILIDPEKAVEKGLTIYEVVDLVKSWKSPVIIPHPADPLSHGLGEEVVKSIRHLNPAIEVFNASTLFIYNNRAKRIAKELGLYEVGGSDAHVASAVGCAYTIVEVEERKGDDVIESLRGGKTQAFGKRMPIFSLLEQSVRRFL